MVKMFAQGEFLTAEILGKNIFETLKRNVYENNFTVT